MATNIKDLNDLANFMSAHNAQDTQLQRRQTSSLDDLNLKFTQYIDWMKTQAEDAERKRLEAEREAKSGRNNPPRPSGSSNSSSSSSFQMPGIAGIAKPLLAITAGLAALAAATAGLRGWEKLAITNADKIGKALRSIIPLTFADKLVGKIVPSGYTTFSAWFGDRMAMLRNSALKLFGFDVDMKGGGIPGGNTGPRMPGGNQLKTPLTTQLSNRMSSFMSMLKGQYYSMVGLGVDGNPVQARNAAGRFGTFKEVSIVHKVTQGISKILQPLRAAGTAITEVMSGAFGKLLTSVGDAGKGLLNSGAGKFFVGVFKKILWPLGVLMSGWEGIKKFQEETGKGEGYAKAFLEGLTTGLSNFIGAPFDLIKNGILWILRKLLPWGVGDDGLWDDGSTIGKIGIWAEQFSFEKLFKSLLMAPFNLITGAVTFIKDLFCDPAGTWEKFAKSVWGEGTFIDNYILNPVANLLKGIGKIFGFGTNDDPMSPDTAGGTVTRVKFLWNDMIEGLTVRLPNKIIAIAAHFKEKVMSIVPEGMFEKIKCIFTHDIPAKITALVTSFKNLFAKTEGAEGDPQPNGSIWTGIKNIFTGLIPNMISDIVTEGKNMMTGIVESVVEKLQGLIDMIFDFIPSAEAIKNKVISSIKSLPAGDELLKTLGIIPKTVNIDDTEANYQKEAFGIPGVQSFEQKVMNKVNEEVTDVLEAIAGDGNEINFRNIVAGGGNYLFPKANIQTTKQIESAAILETARLAVDDAMSGSGMSPAIIAPDNSVTNNVVNSTPATGGVGFNPLAGMDIRSFQMTHPSQMVKYYY